LEINISHATLGDLDLLVTHRLEMWLDIHPELEADVRKSEGATREWIRDKLSEGKLVGFVARTASGAVAGSGCVWIREEQPRPTNPRHETPYLMSMYTEKGYRRKGVAKMIVREAIEWGRERGYERIVLHASKEGRPLYESFGFEPASEMRLKLRASSVSATDSDLGQLGGLNRKLGRLGPPEE
jgi:GNAT superfamily N-acetyltransferase